MADLDEVVDGSWALRQRRDPFAVFRRQNLEHPLRSLLRHDVEPIGLVEPERHLVMIAAHDSGRRQSAHAVDHGVGVGAVADQIAEDEGLVVSTSLRMAQNRFERLEVRVNIGQDEIAHRIEAMNVSAASPKFVCIRPPMHPASRRCSSVKYSRYSPSSRLARRAPRRPRCDNDLRRRDTSTEVTLPASRPAVRRWQGRCRGQRRF